MESKSDQYIKGTNSKEQSNLDIGDKSYDEGDLTSALEGLMEKVGSMGWYQRLLFIMMLPFGFGLAFAYFGQMFITATPQEHWCKVPELQGLDLELRRMLSIPGGNGSDYDKCMMYDRDWTSVLETLLPPSPDTPTVPCQNGWEFLYEDIPYETVVSQREWVCDNAQLVPLAQSLAFAGSIAGGLTLGLMADRLGRLPVLIMANMVGFIGAVGTVFTKGFWDFAVCRFLVGMSCDGCFGFFYILLLEFVGTYHRTWVANVSIALFFGGGSILLPWLALWAGDWQILGLVMAAPMTLALLLPLVVPESIRWLLTKGKYDSAVKVIKKFERINGNKIPDNMLDDFITIARKTEVKKGSIVSLVRMPAMRKTVVCLVMLFVSTVLIFEGIIRLSENLGLDFFITFTITSATELPSLGLLTLLLDRYGRRKLAFIPLILSAMLAFAMAFVPRGVVSVSLAVAARFLTNMTFNTMLQWAPELMPTAVRATASALLRLTGFAASVAVPFILYSEGVWLGLPLVIVAVVATLGAAASLQLPETMGQPMPQTVEDCLNLAKASKCEKITTDEEKFC